MSKAPPRWAARQLAADAEKSAAFFRTERLAPTEAWKEHFTRARERFAVLFDQLGELIPEQISDSTLASAYKGNLGEALRYLADPPSPTTT
jgi:hypothetical protein